MKNASKKLGQNVKKGHFNTQNVYGAIISMISDR